MRNLHTLFRRAAPVLVALLALVFFYRLAFTDSILARGDTYAYFYPYWFARSEAFLSGRLPLWSPDLFMGVPLLANSQIGVFYPLNWPLTWLSPPDAVRVSILFHVGWVLAGSYLLARRVLKVGIGGSVVAAVLFALGGHIGAHVEQINQLQGLSWMPWLFLLFDCALERPLVYTPLLAMGLALQFFSGHTQTVFITGLGLGVYGLLSGKLRFIPILIGGAVGAALLALPQLAPTLEMTSVSNRRGGFNPNQATAFSFSPFVLGRGLLPSYDDTIFGEYVAYSGVIGFGLALIGLTTRPTVTQAVTGSSRLSRWLSRWRAGYSARTTWAVVALVGLFLAFGLYNPVYWKLAALPGFNLFRVPARWLALFALGAAMLAGLGFDALSRGRLPQLGRRSALIVAVTVLLGAASLLATRIPESVPMPAPTVITFVGWAVALVVLLILLALASRKSLRQGAALLIAVAVLAELFISARVLPFNDLTPPDVYSEQRFTTSQLLAYQNEPAPARMLSISNLFFDPGDRAALETRYGGLSASALRNALVAIKMKETMAANLPLIYHIPTIDGFDGGLLPTSYYTAFTSLILPQGTLRTIDGRLRELLALPDCNGACIPDQRWLDLTNTRYLVTDKVYDLVNNGIFYDTQFTVPLGTGETTAIRDVPAFETTAIDVIYRCASGDSCAAPTATLDETNVTAAQVTALDGGDHLARLTLTAPLTPRAVTIKVADAVQVRAVTLVDTRTGDFQQLTLGPWRRILSSDIKLYENLDVMPRVFVAGQRIPVMDDDYGTEYALAQMRDPAYDPAQTAILSGLPKEQAATASAHGRAAITAYTSDRVEVAVDAPDGGTLVLADAYYPGWTATVDGAAAALYRADVMFRGVPLEPGKHTVVFKYKPIWLPGALILGGVFWLLAAVLVVIAYALRHRTRLRRMKS